MGLSDAGQEIIVMIPLLLERGARLDFSRSLAKEWIHKSSTEQVENVVLQWYEAQVEKINPLEK